MPGDILFDPLLRVGVRPDLLELGLRETLKHFSGVGQVEEENLEMWGYGRVLPHLEVFT